MTSPDPATSIRGVASGLRVQAGTLEAIADALDAPTPPPPVDPPPAVVTVTALPSAVEVAWTQPAGHGSAMLSWGSGGVQTGKVGPFEAAAGELIRRRVAVNPSTTVQVDVITGPTPATVAWFGSGTGTSGPADTAPPVITDPGTRPQAPADVADVAGWERWRAAMRAWCGAPTSGLRRIDSPASAAALGTGLTWTGSDLHIAVPCSLQGIDVAGRIVIDGRGIAVKLDEVRAHAVHWSKEVGGTFACRRFSGIGTRAGYPLGQGVINYWGTAGGWLVERSSLAGCADGMQCSTDGTVRDLWVHDLVLGVSPSGGPTHNDGIQIYGGKVIADGYLFESARGSGSNSNGLVITNGPTAVLDGVNVFAEAEGGNVVNPHQGHVYLRHSVLKGGATPYAGQLHRTDCLRL